MKRDFGKLSNMGNAAAANSGSLMSSVQKDRIVYVDPVNEIYYDPEENTRNAEVLQEDIDELISLRLSMDEEQLQPVKLYPLSAEKLKQIGRKPDAKVYGIGYGHRRVLACRLTNKDHPAIGDKPRKVAALIDQEWLMKGKSRRLLSQIQENHNRKNLDYVEQGRAIKDFRDALSEEEGRLVPQRELMDLFHIKEKTLGYLMQAADFHELARNACHRKVLTDLDTLVTFDAIAKTNDTFAKAIYDSLLDNEAPRTRSLIRAAKAKLDAEPDFVVDPSTWSWPEIVEQAKSKPAAEQQVPVSSAAPPVPTASPTTAQEGDVAPQARDRDAGLAPGPDQDKVVDLEYKQRPPQQPPEHEEPEAKAKPKQEPAPLTEKAPQEGPVIVVSFKMAKEAPLTFNGELMVGKAAKAPNMGVVAYLNEGKEELIEVPLKFISLLSINH